MAVDPSDVPVPVPTAGQPWRPPVRVIASGRRRRTVSARFRGGVLEVLVPAHLGERERAHWVEVMRGRIERQLRRAEPTDAALERRAQSLNRRLFAGRLRWSSISWAAQERRWGSCSPASGVIRVSSRAARLPEFVVDYLLVHELAHLEVADHGPAFWDLVNRFPFSERARGYLMALDHAAGEPPDSEPAED